MAKFYVLGIDQSTQGTKAVLFDHNGKMIARADKAHRQILVKDQISHDPEEIYRNILYVIKAVVEKSGIDKNQILCMGIDNQRETTVAWNRENGKPVAHAIVWQCNRAREICKRIGKSESQEKYIYENTGLKLSPYYPAGKMAWFLENIPEAKELAEKTKLALGTIDSWLVYKLTNGQEFKTDYSNASRTQLMNLKTQKWDEEVCRMFGISPDLLPQICDSDSIFGYTDLEGYLEKKIPISSVLGDSHGALYGHNCKEKGKIKVTYGTGSSIMMNTGDTPYLSKYGLSTSIAWRANGKTSYVLEGNINYTGAVISWLKDQLGLISSPTEVEGLAREANPGDTTYIVPAFSGLGAPWWRDDVQAQITGMSRMTGKAEIVRAACDCICYQINDVTEAMRKDTKIALSELCVDGGPTRNQYLMQFQSDISGSSLKVPDIEELSVTGAGFMAGEKMGYYDPAEIYRTISYNIFTPSMENTEKEKKLAGWGEAIKSCLSKGGQNTL